MPYQTLLASVLLAIVLNLSLVWFLFTVDSGANRFEVCRSLGLLDSHSRLGMPFMGNVAHQQSMVELNAALRKK